jgi:thiosulfate/3-mercaptopyruvate sulfurtransferase
MIAARWVGSFIPSPPRPPQSSGPDILDSVGARGEQGQYRRKVLLPGPEITPVKSKGRVQMTTYTTIINVNDAQAHLHDPECLFVDCRFVLSDPDQGFRDYQVSHIKGAVFAHLNHDLSGPIQAGKTGRHPLPGVGQLVETLSRLGIDSQRQVVAYDASSGSMAAARLWWLLKWAGHDAVAVLDGGFHAWIHQGGRVTSGVERTHPRSFTANFRPEMVLDADGVLLALQDPRILVFDSRNADRYRGENETIDPKAGHIPNAVSAPFSENIDPTGRFRSPEELSKRFDALLAGTDASQTIFYCGSGVTAAHNVLACLLAGNPIPRLYAGSWSDWITDPCRPIVKGHRP